VRRRRLGVTTLATAVLCLGMVAGIEDARAETARSAQPAGHTRADLLDIARQQVDRHEYVLALETYQRLLAQSPDDSDLLIEVARVLGYADRNAESAQMYRRVLTVAPQRRADVRRSLAWQTLWTPDAVAAEALFLESLDADPDPADAWRGIAEARQQQNDLSGAVDAYEELLRLTPDDAVMSRRRAQLLVWQGRHQDGIDAFEALVQRDPGDRLSRIGLARALNDAGRHRQALARFGQIDEVGLDADDRFSRARALQWAGFPELADRELLAIDTPDAQWVHRYQTSRELAGRWLAEINGSTDRDGLDTRTMIVGSSLPLRYPAIVGASVRQVRFDDPLGRVRGARFQVDASTRIGTPTDTHGVIWPSVTIAWNDYDHRGAGGGASAGSWHPVTGGVRMHWLPTDLVRIDAELGRETVETPKAVEERVTIDVASIGVEWRPVPVWSLAASLAHLRFDDGNARDRLYVRAERTVLPSPRIRVGLEAQRFSSSDPAGPSTSWRGYWSPDKYGEARLFVSWSHDWQDWQFEARAGLGTARETDGWGNRSSGRPNTWELVAVRDLSPTLQLRAQIGGSGSGMGVGTGGSGYWRRYAGISLIGWF